MVQTLTVSSLLSVGFHLGHTYDKWKPRLSFAIAGFRENRVVHSFHGNILFFRSALCFSSLIIRKFKPVIFFPPLNLFTARFQRTSLFAYFFFLYVPGVLTNFSRLRRDLFVGVARQIFFPSLVLNFKYPISFGLLNEAFLISAPLVTLVDNSIEHAFLAAYPIFSGKASQNFLFILFRFFCFRHFRLCFQSVL